MYAAQSHAESTQLTGEGLDGYAKRGVAITRDAAAVVMAALHRDAYELDTRGGSANNEAAAINRALARSILEALR